MNDNPVDFAEKYLGVKLYKYQEVLLLALWKNRKNKAFNLLMKNGARYK